VRPPRGTSFARFSKNSFYNINKTMHVYLTCMSPTNMSCCTPLYCATNTFSHACDDVNTTCMNPTNMFCCVNIVHIYVAQLTHF
jgi:hypothetical protein